MRVRSLVSTFTAVGFAGVLVASLSGQGRYDDNRSQDNRKDDGRKDEGRNDDLQREGRRLFERETFGGNGRTCLTCHSRRTGTVSPQDAQARFSANPHDPLFLFDGSDDGLGHGVSRMLADATILMTIPLPPNVRFADSGDRFVVVRRGIPTTLNTPALDPVLMLDGRQPTLELQARGAIRDHAQAPDEPLLKDLEAIRFFQMTDAFFSSPELRERASGGPIPRLPRGNTASERRGRRFFEDVPPNPADGFKPGLCAHCHSGTLMDQTSEFAPQFFLLPVKTGTRFQDVLVSSFNDAGNPVRHYVFTEGGIDRDVFSPDPGRALITGLVDGRPDLGDTTFENTDAFKISQLRGIRRTAPYFHDNSAKTLEAVAAHYARFFAFVTDPDGPLGPLPPAIILTPQDQADIVAFLKLLD
jgi:cytochrome c peroxidase